MLSKLKIAVLHHRINNALRAKHAMCLDAAERLHAQNQHIDRLFTKLEKAEPLPEKSDDIARRVAMRGKRLA